MPHIISKNDLLFHFLNVGFGDNIIIEFPEKNGYRSYGLVDCFLHEKTKKYLDKLATLRTAKKQLKFICATHPHKDHIMGIKKFIDDPVYRPLEFWDSGFRHKSGLYLEILDSINTHDVKMVRVSSGMEWYFDKVQISALSPSIRLRNRYATYGVDMNNASIVLRIEHHSKDYVLIQSQEYKTNEGKLAERRAGRSVVILSGDAEYDSWSYITDEFPRREKPNEHNPLVTKMINPISCAVIKVAHHGSMHSTPLDVYEKMKPEVAIISTKQLFKEKNSGPVPLNRPMFPHSTSKSSLEEVGAVILTTDGYYESLLNEDKEPLNPHNCHPGSIVVAVPPGGTPIIKKYNDSVDDHPEPEPIL